MRELTQVCIIQTCCAATAAQAGHDALQDVITDSRLVSFYSNATVYQTVPVNPTPNAQVRGVLVVACISLHVRHMYLLTA